MGEALDKLFIALAGTIRVEGHTRTSKSGKSVHVDAYTRSPGKLSNSELLSEMQGMWSADKSKQPKGMDYNQKSNRYQALVSEMRKRENAGTWDAPKAKGPTDTGAGNNPDHPSWEAKPAFKPTTSTSKGNGPVSNPKVVDFVTGRGKKGVQPSDLAFEQAVSTKSAVSQLDAQVAAGRLEKKGNRYYPAAEKSNSTILNPDPGPADYHGSIAAKTTVQLQTIANDHNWRAYDRDNAKKELDKRGEPHSLKASPAEVSKSKHRIEDEEDEAHEKALKDNPYIAKPMKDLANFVDLLEQDWGTPLDEDEKKAIAEAEIRADGKMGSKEMDAWLDKWAGGSEKTESTKPAAPLGKKASSLRETLSEDKGVGSSATEKAEMTKHKNAKRKELDNASKVSKVQEAKKVTNSFDALRSYARGHAKMSTYIDAAEKAYKDGDDAGVDKALSSLEYYTQGSMQVTSPADIIRDKGSTPDAGAYMDRMKKDAYPQGKNVKGYVDGLPASTTARAIAALDAINPRGEYSDRYDSEQFALKLALGDSYKELRFEQIGKSVLSELQKRASDAKKPKSWRDY